MGLKKRKQMKSVAFLLAIVLLLPLFSINVFAKTEDKKVVRVAYYEDHNFQAGASEGAIKSGYSYEYLKRLQMHTNWEYEYVYGDFSEVYDALVNGDVDIITGLAYKEEREEFMSYPELSMGQTLYSLIKKQGRDDLTSNPKSLNGKTFGALEGPILTALQNYLNENGIDGEIITYTDLYESDRALMDGTLDVVLLESSAQSALKEIEVVDEVGANDYYVCVAKNRPDILEDLNNAQRELFHAKPRLKEELYDKWLRRNVQSATLNATEKEWVETHNEFRVGYFNTYLPYSDTDDTGNVTGIVKDVVPELLNTLNIDNVEPVFQGYDTYDDMLTALQAGEIDAIFPVYSEYYSAESYGITPTDGVINAYYNLVYKGDYPNTENSRIALRKSNKLVQAYAMIQFPCCEIVFCDTVQECLDAVLEGKVDLTLINGLRTPSYMLYDKKYSSLRCSQLAGNVPLGFGLSVNDGQTAEVLNHAIGLIDSDFALGQTHLYEQEYKMTTSEFLKQNWWIIVLPVMIVILVILISVIAAFRKNKKILVREAAYNKELTEKIREISNLQQEADAANKAKTEFLFNVSHDIRTPMNAITGYSQLMKKELTDPKLIEYQEKIDASAKLLLSIINHVLDMSSIESGKEHINEECTYVPDIAATIINVFEEEARKKKINLNCNIDYEHNYILCDQTKMHELYTNILSNAIKYTPAGGNVDVLIEELPSERDGYLTCRTTISDTGIGMSEEFLPHIFDSFSRERNSTTSGIQGTGLGMSIVKKLVDLLDGTIEVESELGKGSTFIVSLPHKIATEADILQVNVSSKEGVGFALEGKHILLAEDNELNAEIAIAILEDVGVQVDWAKNGKHCLEQIENHPTGTYDLILMDIQMPVMNGYEATKAIRSLAEKDKATIPIVAMTANAFEEDKKDAFAAGMNGHIAKPLNLDELFKQLADVLS
ncbi:MAG: transporter substrate-binding domain-containing protein [Eubacteriales bacterium]|nr:transporter substrate-binding domain-containing protein [Eubacteriales bacterium]